MYLSKDGIFPIVKDKNGQLLSQRPASGFDFAGTIQGEGKLIGVPSIFIRLAGCNLHCCWKNTDDTISACDTAYAAYAIEEAFSLSTEDIFQIIQQNQGAVHHIVITGGEPLLQAKELSELCRKLKAHQDFHVTIETNATLFDAELAQYIDLFSLSPKLHTSAIKQTNHQVKRINIPAIQSFISTAHRNNKAFQLKFVYSSDEDIVEIKEILSHLSGWQNDDVLLMPLGGCIKDVRLNTQKTLEHCIRNGWRFCDRLHISLFGTKTGV